MGPRIMVIDDDNIVGKVLRAVLEQEGYEIELFFNPSRALTRMKEEPFNVVITDLKMKGMNGLDLVRTIKEEHPETKVIMVTAFASVEIVVEALRRKVDDFFAKPVRIADIKDCISRLLSETSDVWTDKNIFAHTGDSVGQPA